MKTLDLSFSEPALNLACDEVLLDEVHSGNREPTLRFWESPSLFVVVGYGNDIERECHTQACEKLGIPILRRASGGGTVLQGPGCLNYSLILQIADNEKTGNIGTTNCHVMTTNRDASRLVVITWQLVCLLYTSPSPRDQRGSRMPSSA